MRNLFGMYAGDVARRLKAELRSRFIPMPGCVCECGKAVVFPYPSRNFKCTRCGKKWKLIIKIKPVS